jgi:hypothetical protein
VGVESYLAVLDTVLEDRRVTATGAESLRDLAVSLGVGAEAVIAAHQMYLPGSRSPSGLMASSRAPNTQTWAR